MDTEVNDEPINILLIEDNHTDIRMIKEIFKEFKTKTNIYAITNGIEALEFLNKKENYHNKPLPNLIMLDLNIPLINGFKVLKEIKTDDKLKHIPVIVLTTSHNPNDLSKAYELQANCFMNKPICFDEYNTLLKHIEECWLKINSINKN
ncbi:response regulator [Methanobacterium sp.]|uniref:response regulator n=1 Tax=Methanobacterium sp. TaxID=2164 RepID=UPI003C7763DB